MNTCRARISIAAIALGLAILGVFVTSNFVFTGNATLYAEFVLRRVRDWVIISTLASIALVVSVPVFWRGEWPDKLLAIVFILLAPLIPIFSYEMIF